MSGTWRSATRVHVLADLESRCHLGPSHAFLSRCEGPHHTHRPSKGVLISPTRQRWNSPTITARGQVPAWRGHLTPSPPASVRPRVSAKYSLLRMYSPASLRARGCCFFFFFSNFWIRGSVLEMIPKAVGSLGFPSSRILNDLRGFPPNRDQSLAIATIPESSNFPRVPRRSPRSPPPATVTSKGCTAHNTATLPFFKKIKSQSLCATPSVAFVSLFFPWKNTTKWQARNPCFVFFFRDVLFLLTFHFFPFAMISSIDHEQRSISKSMIRGAAYPFLCRCVITIQPQLPK